VSSAFVSITSTSGSTEIVSLIRIRPPGSRANLSRDAAAIFILKTARASATRRAKNLPMVPQPWSRHRTLGVTARKESRPGARRLGTQSGFGATTERPSLEGRLLYDHVGNAAEHEYCGDGPQNERRMIGSSGCPSARNSLRQFRVPDRGSCAWTIRSSRASVRGCITCCPGVHK